MCFGLFKDSGCDFKRSELLYSFIQNLAGVIINVSELSHKPTYKHWLMLLIVIRVGHVLMTMEYTMVIGFYTVILYQTHHPVSWIHVYSSQESTCVELYWHSHGDI